MNFFNKLESVFYPKDIIYYEINDITFDCILT